MDLAMTEKLDPGLTGGNLSRLQRFKIRTAMSLGPPELRQIYENEVFELTLNVTRINCLILNGWAAEFDSSILS